MNPNDAPAEEFHAYERIRDQRFPALSKNVGAGTIAIKNVTDEKETATEEALV